MTAHDANHPAERALALLLKPNRTKADMNDAARLLLRDMGPSLIRYVRHKIGLNEDDAEEALTDAVFQFIRTPPEIGTAGGWLYKTVLSRGTDIYRRGQAIKRGGEHEHISLDTPANDADTASLTPQVASTDDIAGSYEGRQLIQAIINKFASDAPTYVETLYLVMQGFSEQEVADQLGISKVAAKSKIHEVRTLARKFFKD